MSNFLYVFFYKMLIFLIMNLLKSKGDLFKI